MKESATRVQVSVRIRPPPSGNNDPNAISAVNAASLIAMDEKGSRREFKFDRVFTGDQSPVFETIGRPMLAEAFKGFNVCLFAYGQTGSGKTHSLLGDVENEQQQGVAPRFARSLFEEAQRMVEESDDLTIKISLSMIEVYMEKIRDLLVPRQRGVEPESLDIHEDAERRVYVKDVSVHHVMNFERMMDLLRKGNANRQTAETKMNETSSRSHAIMQITISQEFQSVEKRDLECMVSLVDLAGSERQTKTDTSGQRFEESKKINYSLMMLGRAMKAFSERKNNEAFISLRESKLTRLLSESFGGNSKTWMLATVSPGVPNYSESISTLEYATNAMAITNKAIVNVNKCLKEMSHEELSKIRNALAAAVQKESSEADALSAKCCEVRMEVENLKRDWTQFDQLKSIEREIAEALDDRNKLLRSLSCELRRHVTSSTERLICFSGTCKTSFACVPMGSYEIVTLGVPFYSVVGPPPLLECHLHLNVTADGDVVAIVKITTVEHVPDFATGGVQISIWFLERGGSKVLTPVVQPQEGSASFDYMQTYVFGPMTDNLKEYLQGESLMIQVDGLLEELA